MTYPIPLRAADLFARPELQGYDRFVVALVQSPTEALLRPVARRERLDPRTAEPARRRAAA
jgi:hypothetical protein